MTETSEGRESEVSDVSQWYNYPPEIVALLLELRDKFAEVYDAQAEDKSEEQEALKQDIENELQKLDTEDQVKIFVDGVQVTIAYTHWKWHQRKYSCSIWNDENSVEISASMKRMILELIIHKDKFFPYRVWNEYKNARVLRDERCSLSPYIEYRHGIWIRFNASKWCKEKKESYSLELISVYIWDDGLYLWLTRNEDEIVILSDWEIIKRMNATTARPGLMQSIKETTLRPNPWVNQELKKLGVKLVRIKGKLVLEGIEK